MPKYREIGVRFAAVFTACVLDGQISSRLAVAPSGISGGTSMVIRRLAGIVTVCSIVMT